jgi:hypothetical protein
LPPGVSPFGPGINYAELKPVGYSPEALAQQLDSWGLQEGETSLWLYNDNGIIGNSGWIW